MKQKIQIFSPATKEVKQYGLGKEIDVKLNSGVIIPMIADKIYKSPYAPVRELYNNEITACEKALKIDPSLKPEIIITLDTNTREFKIKGINSLGMDSQTLNKILAVLGNSGNNEYGLKGFFGIGFYSFLKMSERIIINSYSLETKEKFAYICKSALKFEKLRPENYDPLDKTGFEITLTIKNDLKFEEITLMIQKITLLSGIKTTYEIDEVKEDLEQHKDLLSYFNDKYQAFFLNRGKHGILEYSIIYEHINNDDYELIIGYASKTAPHLAETFLLNTPIELESDYEINSEIRLINLKNERKFRPTPDRERFEEKSEEMINEILKKHEFNKQERLNEEIKTIDQWYDSELRFFHGKIQKIDFYSSVKSLEVENTGYRKGKYLFDSLNDHLPKEKPKGFMVSPTFRPKRFLEFKHKGIFCIAIRHPDSEKIKNYIDIGFKDIDADKKKKQAQRKTNRNYKPDFNYNFVYHTKDESFDLPEAHALIFKVENIREEKSSLLSHLGYHDKRIMLVTGKAYCSRARELKEIPKMLKGVMFWTNKGIFNGKQIIEIIKIRKESYIENDTNILLRKFYHSHPRKFIILSHHKNLFNDLLRIYINYINKSLWDNSNSYRDRDVNTWQEALNEEITDPDLIALIEDLKIDKEKYFIFKRLQYDIR